MDLGDVLPVLLLALTCPSVSVGLREKVATSHECFYTHTHKKVEYVC